MPTRFVSSCVDATADSVARVERKTPHRPSVQQFLHALAGKERILVTTHEDPDPDGLASAIGLSYLLGQLMPAAVVVCSFKGHMGGGLNRVFAEYTVPHYVPWDQLRLSNFDAICLVDAQPEFTNSPLPQEILPLVTVDHHPPRRGGRHAIAFRDVRREVGATSTIIFSYFMEKDVDIPKDIAALMLYGIESDLAGLAGHPGDLDNIALSTLTLVADTRKLYKIRFVDLPQSYYVAFFNALSNAVTYDRVIVSHLPEIDSPEQPAVIADFLLRYEHANWVLVTAVSGQGLVLSLRTDTPEPLAGAVMSRLICGVGKGGGHPTKAGGYAVLADTTPESMVRMRETLKRRLLKALGVRHAKAHPLIPRTKQ